MHADGKRPSMAPTVPSVLQRKACVGSADVCTQKLSVVRGEGVAVIVDATL